MFADLGIPEEMVQDNHSRSRKGIVRGMHFQIGQGAAKLVRCARGAIVDVMVDIRRGSPTFGEWEAFELTEENMRSVYCPIGFAHGFCVLSDVADVMYKQSNYYADATERGIAYNDPDVAIEWPLPVEELIPSQRDATAPLLRDIEAELPFVYGAANGAVPLKQLISGERKVTLRTVFWTMEGSTKQRVLAVASSGGHWVQLRRLAPAFEDHDVAYLTTDPGHRSEVAGATVLRGQRRQSVEQVRARALRAEDSLGAPARAPHCGRLDRRSSRLPRDSVRKAARSTHDLDRQRRQRRGAFDVRADGERTDRSVPDAVAASRRRPRPVPRGRVVIFVTVGTQLRLRPADRRPSTNGLALGRARGVRADRPEQAAAAPHRACAVRRRRRSAASGCEPRTAIVAHAGMGTILTALEIGKPLLVMPRRAALGEHRNDHQLATARRFADLGELQRCVRRDRACGQARRTRPGSRTARRSADYAPDELVDQLRAFIVGRLVAAVDGNDRDQRGSGRLRPHRR